MFFTKNKHKWDRGRSELEDLSWKVTPFKNTATLWMRPTIDGGCKKIAGVEWIKQCFWGEVASLWLSNKVTLQLTASHLKTLILHPASITNHFASNQQLPKDTWGRQSNGRERLVFSPLAVEIVIHFTLLHFYLVRTDSKESVGQSYQRLHRRVNWIHCRKQNGWTSEEYYLAICINIVRKRTYIEHEYFNLPLQHSWSRTNQAASQAMAQKGRIEP